MARGGFGWFWVVLAGFGWFWLVLGDFGWFWVIGQLVGSWEVAGVVGSWKRGNWVLRSSWSGWFLGAGRLSPGRWPAFFQIPSPWVTEIGGRLVGSWEVAGWWSWEVAVGSWEVVGGDWRWLEVTGGG